MENQLQTSPVTQSKVISNKLMDNEGNINLSIIDDVSIQKYKNISSQLTPSDPNSIINFGSETQSSVASFSDSFLTNVRSNDAGDVGVYINNLLTEIGHIDIDRLEQTPMKRFLMSLPFVKHIVMNTKKLFQQYDTVSANVNKIATQINTGRLNSIKDNGIMNSMFIKKLESISQLEELIIAAQIKLNESSEELVEMKKQSANYQDYEISDKENFNIRLDKRIADLKVSRFISIQSIAQIKIIQNTNLVIAEKAQTILNTTIPLWKDQLMLAVSLYRQSQNIEMQKKVSDTTNAMLLKNSELLKTNSITAARESEKTIVSIETLRKTTKDLTDTLVEMKRIHDEGTATRKLLSKDLSSLENEVKANVINVSNASALN